MAAPKKAAKFFKNAVFWAPLRLAPSRNLSPYIAPLLLVLYAAWGFYTLPDFGVHLDELTQRTIGMENNRFLSGRVGFDKVNEHGLFGPIWESFCYLAEQIYFPGTMRFKILLHRALLWSVFMLAMVSLYRFAQRKIAQFEFTAFPKWLPQAHAKDIVALLPVAFILLWPRIFADAHYNSKDVLFLAFQVWVLIGLDKIWVASVRTEQSSVSGGHFAVGKGNATEIISGAAVGENATKNTHQNIALQPSNAKIFWQKTWPWLLLGISCSIRFSGFMIAGFAALVSFIQWRNNGWKWQIKQLLFAVFTTVVGYVAFYPYLWFTGISGFAHIWQFVSQNPWPHATLVDGQWVNQPLSPQPWNYLLIWIQYTLGEWQWIVIVCALCLWLNKRVQRLSPGNKEGLKNFNASAAEIATSAEGNTITERGNATSETELAASAGDNATLAGGGITTEREIATSESSKKTRVKAEVEASSGANLLLKAMAYTHQIPAWRLFLWLMLFGFFGYSIALKPVIYNGWRHLYFLILPISLLSSFAVVSHWKSLQKGKNAMLAILLLPAFWMIWQLVEPQKITNQTLESGEEIRTILSGFVSCATDFNELQLNNFSLDYWQHTTLQAYQYLLNKYPSDTIVIGGKGESLWLNYLLLPEAQQKRIRFDDFWQMGLKVGELPNWASTVNPDPKSASTNRWDEVANYRCFVLDFQEEGKFAAENITKEKTANWYLECQLHRQRNVLWRLYQVN